MKNIAFAVVVLFTLAVLSQPINQNGALKIANPSMTTEQLQALIDSAAASNQIVHFRAGTYSLKAIAQVTGEMRFLGALRLRRNLHIECDVGAVLQLAGGQSTDANPQDIAMFYSGDSVSHISIRGCTLDMNYPSNKISPKRGTAYNLYPFAQIRVSGTNAAITDGDFENNTFVNGPGATCIAIGQSNVAGSALGDQITIAHNLFKNNGMDVGDFSCIYGWGTNVNTYDNVFTQDSPAPIESPFHGTFMAFEIHGANSTFHDNQVVNYGGGGYIANNFTSRVSGADVYNNSFKTTWVGIKFFNSNAASKGVSDAKIHDNTFEFLDHRYGGSPPVQIGIDISPHLAVSNIQVSHNHFGKADGNEIGASAFRAAPPKGVTFTGLVFSDNVVTGMSDGVELMTNLGGSLGQVEISRNKFLNLTKVAGFGADGIFANAENSIETLTIDGNSFINNAGTDYTFGIYLAKGTITNLHQGQQLYQGIRNRNYAENAVLVMNRHTLGQ